MMNTQSTIIPTRIETGDTVRLRGTDILGVVIEARFAGFKAKWDDGRTHWSGYAGAELISKS